MGVKFDIVTDRTLKIADKLEAALFVAELITAEAIREEAAQGAPHEERHRIGDSLAVEADPGALEVRVGAGGHWGFLGVFHEFGTVKMPAHPFMTPAVEAQRAPHEERMRAAGNKIIEEA
jgi:HK97 gp10 family phage protein